MKTCVIIPTYNESKEIAKLIKSIKQHIPDILVIDDGSEDNTEKIARENGAVVLKNEFNRGKGSSLIRGFDYAIQEKFDAVITMDGDGQHVPEDIPYFIRLAQYSDCSIFIGNRMHRTKNMPLSRMLTNKFMSWVLSVMAKQKIPDTQCGFRLIKRDALKKINLTTSNFDTESEMLLRGSRLGFKIESVPVKTVYRNEKSKINPVTDTFRFIKLIAQEIWTTPI